MKMFFGIVPLITRDTNGNQYLPWKIHFLVDILRKDNVQKVNRVARIYFDETEIHQTIGGKIVNPYHTLLFGTIDKKDTLLSMWIDTGKELLPVAHMYQKKRKLIGTNQYEELQQVKKLSHEQLLYLFNHVLDYPSTIDIIPSYQIG